MQRKRCCLRGGNNLLIEGDNYHSLIALNYLEKESVDVIYIDPPYNTGNTEKQDFTYNDKFVDLNDGYRHSKWLSFMEKRLILSRNLLNDFGIFFVSIDDNELCNLKLLCDSIFGENNFIANCFVLDNLKGKTNDNFISSVGSRLLVYAKNKRVSNTHGFNDIENVFGAKIEDKYTQQDNFGFFNLITFKKTGQSKSRHDRPYMFYPILEKDKKLFSITEDEFRRIYNKDTKEFDDAYLNQLKSKYYEYNFILPVDSKGEYLRWTSGFNTYLKKMNNEIIFDNGVKQKTRPEPSEMLQLYASGTPKTLMYKPSYSTGTEDLKNVMNVDSTFSFPKPVELMKDILKLYPNKNLTILDFFAGSGTTGQAVLELNKEDSGHRKFILCTNNENNICTDVTYPRLKTVITGIRSDGTKYSDGINANLRYFKTEFLKDNSNRDQAKYELVEKVDSLLCIYEDIYDEIERNDYSSHYHNGNKHMFIFNEYFDIEKFNEFKKRVINTKGQKIVYIFTNNNYLDEDYFKGNNDIEVKPIPAKIYEVYKEIVGDIKRG